MAIGPDRLCAALAALRTYPGVRECMVLSTCNRTEVYTVSDAAYLGDSELHQAVRFLADFHEMDLAQIEPCLYRFEGTEAVEHLFKVACGLDSMVLGENEILRQVRDAYSAACDARCTGSLLNRLAHATFKVGKEVRTKTRLNEGSLSVSYAACDLATKVFRDLTSTKVLVIGAGETGELTAFHMKKRGVRDMVVANRTVERAEALAARLACAVLPMSRLAQGLSRADIVVSCTAGAGYVVTRSMVVGALRNRSNGAPMFLIDLAVPRDVEESVGELDRVHLYNIDDLQEIVSANSSRRRAEQQKAVEIVDRAVKQFQKWRESLVATPTIRDIRELFEQVMREELDRHGRRLTSDQLRAAETVSNAVISRIAKLAIGNIKTASHEPDADDFLDVVRRLFDLERDKD